MITHRTSNDARYDTLDGMRGVAAIAVMIFHFTQYRMHRPFSSASLAVDLFFMLSGFVITHSYARRLLAGLSAREYLLKRLIRLHPTFLLGIALGTAVLCWLEAAGMTRGTTSPVASMLANMFYIPSFNDISIQAMGAGEFSSTKIFPANPPAWSLFFEVMASFAFLALIRMKRSVLLITVAASFAAFLACGFVHSYHDHRLGFDLEIGWGPENFYGGFPRVIFGFAAGMFIYSLVIDERFPNIRVIVRRYVGSSFLVYLALLLVFLFPTQLRGIYPALVLVTVAPALIYVGSLVPCDTRVSLHAARFLGWISYPLYCFHFPIGHVVFLVAGRYHLSNSVALAAAILLSMAVAALLTKVYEEPVRAFLSGRLARTTSVSPTPRVLNQAR